VNCELNFIAKLYQKAHISRKDVDEIIADTKELFDEVLQGTALERTSFENLSTEAGRIRLFKSKNLFVAPENVQFEGVNCATSKPFVMQYISIKKTLQVVLGRHDCLKKAQLYMKTTSNILNDLKDATSFRNVCSDQLLPYVLYYDDFESGNPLGSHKGVHKIGAVYMSLRCLPPPSNSKLRNIYLVALFHSAAREKLGNTRMFSCLIDEICELETSGIVINGIHCRFLMCGILGDNLGLNSVLGYTESFNANFYCRFCKMSKLDAQHSTREKASLLRNIVNYEDDLLEEDLSSTGIKERCAFNRIPSFHATKHLFVDVMHDIMEGVANYDISSIFSYYVDNFVVSLEHLNNRIQCFPYASFNISNKPPCIKKSKLKTGDIGFNASEMHALIYCLPLIIGDLVPARCEVWQFFLLLYKIVQISSSKSVTIATSEYLDVIVEEHNERYKRLFRKTLKPKFHFLTHYGG
jgi:hypothetical protein